MAANDSPSQLDSRLEQYRTERGGRQATTRPFVEAAECLFSTASTRFLCVRLATPACGCTPDLKIIIIFVLLK